MVSELEVKSAADEMMRETVLRVAARLEHAAEMARISLGGNEPEDASMYLVLALEDVAADLGRLRVATES